MKYIRRCFTASGRMNGTPCSAALGITSAHSKGDHLKHIGIILSGAVDMVKEDLWGNKTMLMRMRKDELFGETFACGSDSLSVVTFVVSEDAKVLFMPFDRVMHSCTMACQFHHRLIENMVKIIADKNRDLMRKVDVVSKRTIRE